MPLFYISLYSIERVKELNKEKNKKMEELREKENKLETRKVEYQKLTSEDEVVRKAKERFDLIRIDHLDLVNINNNKIKNLKKYVAKKYD